MEQQKIYSLRITKTELYVSKIYVQNISQNKIGFYTKNDMARKKAFACTFLKIFCRGKRARDI